MRINEKDQQTEKYENINFDSCSKYIYDETPLWKRLKTENVKIDFDEYPKYVLVRPLFTSGI